MKSLIVLFTFLLVVSGTLFHGEHIDGTEHSVDCLKLINDKKEKKSLDFNEDFSLDSKCILKEIIQLEVNSQIKQFVFYKKFSTGPPAL